MIFAALTRPNVDLGQDVVDDFAVDRDVVVGGLFCQNFRLIGAIFLSIIDFFLHRLFGLEMSFVSRMVYETIPTSVKNTHSIYTGDMGTTCLCLGVRGCR